MEKQNTDKSSSPEDVKVIHVKIINGSHADVYEIGQALKTFKKSLPFRLEAFVTDDKVDLRSVDVLIDELRKLQRIEKKKNEMSNLST